MGAPPFIYTPEFITLFPGQPKEVTIVFADLPAGIELDRLQTLVQGFLEFRVRANQLPSDDPDRAADPGRESAFWEGTGGNREVVYRGTVVEALWVNPGQPGIAFKRPVD